MGALAGFANAPVSKGLCLLVVGASFVSSYAGVAHRMTLHLPRILRGEAWRLLTSQLVFQETPQTVLGAFLIYTFRQLERQMGSRKYGSFLFISTVLATSLEVAAARFLKILPASGPFGAIYAAFVLFYATVPKLHPRLLGFFGVDFSDKSLYYAVGAQLLLGGSWATAVPALCGVVAGLMYRSNLLAVQRFQLPLPLCRLFAMLGPVLNARRDVPRQRRQRRQGGAGGREQLIPGGGMPRYAQQAAPATVEPPSEEAIQTLMGLGFERAAVIRALQASGNSVEVAANRLLAGAG